jgi:D-3-phosphoglycerate dehydrogenase
MSVVLVTDHPAPDTAIEARMLESIGAVLRVAPTGAEDELVAMAADAVGILTCFRHVTPAVVRAAPGLRVIGRYGVGVDNIAVSTATELGIPVTNVPVYCVDEVAEHALALILTLARGTALYDASVRDGGWDLAVGMPLHRISGSTLGIVGFGHIGQALATRARALGLTLLVNDRSATIDEVEPFGATLVDLDELLAASDFVSLHVPLTPETNGLIDARRIALMRPNAFLVNCARGAIVDLDALARALAEGRIAGAGLDVFVPERLPVDHPLVGMRNVALTPHVAFYSEESIAELQRRATQNVIDVLTGGRPEHIVNAQELGSASAAVT